MNITVAIIMEIVMLFLNLLIFMQLTILKKDSTGTKASMYIGTASMIGAFVVCTSYFKMPEMISSFVCVTIPSSTLFFILSKYKDMRFFVTFCFLDTVMLVITFLGRAIEMLWGEIPGSIAYAVICVAMCVVYIKGRPYFKRYRELMENVRKGWGAMAVSSALIYLLLVFTAGYPQPLVERTEYIIPYTLLAFTIISFYVVFLVSIFEKRVCMI